MEMDIDMEMEEREGSILVPGSTGKKPDTTTTLEQTSTSTRKNTRTWAGRESPSASPRLSKKPKPAAGPSSSVTFPALGSVHDDVGEGEDAGMWEGDTTLTQEEYDFCMEAVLARSGRDRGGEVEEGRGNADEHHIGFEVWSDDLRGGSGGGGYFDGMDSGFEIGLGGNGNTGRGRTRSAPHASGSGSMGTSSGTPVVRPKYTAENIRMVGRGGGGGSKNITPTPSAGVDAEEKDKGNEQENVPPAGWIDWADYEEDKEKDRCAKGKADGGASSTASASGSCAGGSREAYSTPSRRRRPSDSSITDPPSTGGDRERDVRRAGSSASLSTTTPSTGGRSTPGSAVRGVGGIRAVPPPSPSPSSAKVLGDDARRLRSGRNL